MGLQELLAEWGSQQRFSLALSNVRLEDEVSAKPSGNGLTMRRKLSAIGTLRPHPNPLLISAAGVELDELRAYVTVVFLPESARNSGWHSDSGFGWIKRMGSDPPSAAMEPTLSLEIALPLEFRERFTDNDTPPLIYVTLAGFADLGENKKRWDAERESLLVIECRIVDADDKSRNANSTSRARADPQSDVDVHFHSAVTEFMDNVHRQFRRWETGAIIGFVTLLCVALSRC